MSTVFKTNIFINLTSEKAAWLINRTSLKPYSENKSFKLYFYEE